MLLRQALAAGLTGERPVLDETLDAIEAEMATDLPPTGPGEPGKPN